MKKKDLPVYEQGVLEDNNIKKQDILAVCPTDLSFEGEYEDSYLVLTADKLVGITKKSDSEYVLRTFMLEELSHVHIENMVATNLLRATKDGEHVRIAVSTNTYLEEMTALVKQLKILLKSEVIVQEQPEEEEEVQEQTHGKSKKSIFVRALSYFLNYKWQIFLLILCYILTAVLSIAWPYLSGTVLYDSVLARNDEFLAGFGVAGEYVLALALLVVVMLGIKILQTLTEIVQGVAMANIVTKSVRDMKKDVFSSIENLTMRFYTSKQTGNLMTRVLRDAERVTDFYLEGLPYLFINSFTIIITFVIMFKLSWQMSVIACILLPLLVVLSVKLKPGLWTLFGRRHRAESSVNSRVNDNLTGARVVRSFGQEQAEIERFEAPNDYLRDAEVRIVKYNNRFTLLYEMVQVVSSIWVWALGVVLVMNLKSVSLGVLITFVGYVSQLNGPMKFFSWVFRMWSDSINAAQRMFEIIDAVPDVVESSNPVRLVEPKGKIEIKNVTFGYNKMHPVLKNINLKVEPGEMLGIVGRSGAGKTTLVNLLSRLYDVDEGNIYIDGVDVRELAVSDLRKNIAVVSQDTYIFMGTVAQNIAYANENATREDIIRAAKLASAHEFISKMPDGYDTMIGASGQSLSGGEKQRLSIARAIIANPKILILDEATASVDTATEKAIQRSLNMLVEGRTTLSIAHRLSTLSNANHLIVIERGKIVEEGTREELEELGGIYHHLRELQTGSLQMRGIE